MLILKNVDILVMELDLIEEEVFQLVKMYWFLGQIWLILLILIIKKYILVLGIGPTQGLEHTLTPEKIYSINFTEKNKKFCLILDYNGAKIYLFVNGKKIIKFKAKDSEIVASPLCLGNILKDWLTDNIKKTGLNGYVYVFNVDYRYLNPTKFDKNIPIIFIYFMLKYDIK